MGKRLKIHMQRGVAKKFKKKGLGIGGEGKAVVLIKKKARREP